MIKVAIFADHHFDEGSRFEECIRVHDWIAEDIARRGVDLALSGGDVYERKSTPTERRAVAAWVQRIAATCPLVIVRGNHDALADLPLLEKLHTLHPITVVEDARVVQAGGAVIGCLGWPNKANILALAGAVSREESEQTARAALRDVLRGLGDTMAICASVDGARESFDSPRILLAHAMVCGSVTSVGQPLVGCDLEVAIEDLALASADLYALGHVHKGQEWTTSGNAPVIYPGSPRRTAFGEVESKGYLLATFDGAELVSVERIETPCARMFLVTAAWSPDDGIGGSLVIDGPAITTLALGGAEVRLSYSVASDQRESARVAAEMFRDHALDLGAVNVKLVEQVIAQGSARAPEVAAATTLEDRIHAYWTARGTTPEAARAARLVSMANALQEGAIAV